MSDIIQNTINRVLGDVARPTKFKCQIFPSNELMQKYNLTYNDLDVYCYAGSFPGISTQVVDYKFRGRNIPLRGIQEYEQKWTATFYNDENHKLRQLFIDWMESSQTWNYYDKEITDVEPISIHCYQLDFELHKETAIYSMFYVFPINVSPIDFNGESLNQIQTFTVEFAFTYFEYSVIKNQGLSANDISNRLKSAVQNIANSVFNKVKNKVKDKIVNPIINQIENKTSGVFSYFEEKASDFLG